MLIESKVVISVPRQSKETHVGAKVNGNGVTRELPNRINLQILSGERINTANGKKLDKVNEIRPHQFLEKFAPPQESTDVLKRFGDTMLVSDVLKDAEEVRMFEEVGATVDGLNIAFPKSGVTIRRAPSERGNPTMAFQNGESVEIRSLNHWAIRDVENGNGPVVELISPLRKNGTFEVMKFEGGKAKHNVLDVHALKERSSAEEGIAGLIAEKLSSLGEVKSENPVKNTYAGAVVRDFPRVRNLEHSSKENSKIINKMRGIKEQIKILTEAANDEEIQKIINKSEPFNERDEEHLKVRFDKKLANDLNE